MMSDRVSTTYQSKHWNETERFTFLRTVRPFGTLPPAVLHQTALGSKVRQVERGEFVYLSDQPVDGLSIVAEGRVKVVRDSDDGHEVILRLIYPGDVFGMVGSWNEPYHRNSAVAQSDGTVLWIPRTEFFGLLEKYPSFTLAVLHEFGSRLRDAETRISDLQTRQAACRIAGALVRAVRKLRLGRASHSDVTVQLSRQDIADLSGTNLCTASRILSSWDRSGIVLAGREHVRIIQLSTLVAIAEGMEAAETAQ